MVATNIKKIEHSLLCATGVYSSGITDMNFVILHLNVSHLSVCSSCFVVVFVLFPFYFFNFCPLNRNDQTSTCNSKSSLLFLCSPLR